MSHHSFCRRLVYFLLFATSLIGVAGSKHHDSSFGVLSSRVASRQRHEERIQEAYRTMVSEPGVNADKHDDDDEELHIEDSVDDYDSLNESVNYDRYEPTMTSLSRHKPSMSASSSMSSSHQGHRQQPQDQEDHPFLQIPCRLATFTKDDRADSTTSSSGRATRRHDKASTLSSTSSSPPSAFSCCCCIDTGAQRTVMSMDCVKASGLLSQVDRRYAGQAIGVGGSVQVLGRIPAGVVQLQFGGGGSGSDSTAMAPSITVIERVGPKTGASLANGESQSIDLLLGLDFLREHRAVLDLRQEDLLLHVRGRPIRVSFQKSTPKVTVERSTYYGGIGRCRGSSKEEFADFSDDDEYDSNMDGVDLTGF